MFRSNAFFRYRGTDCLHYVAQYPATSVEHYNNFPFIVARILKFGAETIYLVLDMTKEILIFLPLFPS